VKPVRAGDLPRDRNGVMIIGDGSIGIGDVFPGLPSISIPRIAPMAPGRGRVFEFDGNIGDGINMRLDPEARMQIERSTEEATRRAREATRDLMQRLQRLQINVDGRADDDAAEAVIAPPPPARPRTGSRIASSEAAGAAGGAYGYTTTPRGGYVTASGGPYAPEAMTVASPGNAAYAVPAVSTGSSVAVWDGNEATFTLNGLRLARINSDLAENLGRGSERGFLILDASARWSGLRAGDVLLAVDGNAVRDGTSARISLAAGDDHTAQIIRDGQKRTVSLDVR
jgi:hypothetical protein